MTEVRKWSPCETLFNVSNYLSKKTISMYVPHVVGFFLGGGGSKHEGSIFKMKFASQ